MVGTTILTHPTPLLDKSCHNSIYSYTLSYYVPRISNNFKTATEGRNKLCSFFLLEGRAEINFYALKTSMKFSTCKYLDLHNNLKNPIVFILLT